MWPGRGTRDVPRSFRPWQRRQTMEVPVRSMVRSSDRTATLPTPTAHRDPERPGLEVGGRLAQRGRMILDVSRADLEEAEARLGPFHETTWHFRQALDERPASWDRLPAAYGTPPPGGRAGRAAAGDPGVCRGWGGWRSRPPRSSSSAARPTASSGCPGTPLAPLQYRLTRLPPLDDGPYYACQLRDGSTQCDCTSGPIRSPRFPTPPLQAPRGPRRDGLAFERP